MKIFWLSVSLLVAIQANAQGVIAAVNGECPFGWSQSGGYCKPMFSEQNGAVVTAVGGNCPLGWHRSGSFCTPGQFARPAIKKSGSGCPLGWRTDSNDFCTK